MDLKEICINTRNWVDSGQERDYWISLVNAALNLQSSIRHGVSYVKPIGKRHVGRTKCGCEENIKMDLKEISIKTTNWVHSAQDRDYWRPLVNVPLNLRVP